MSERRKTKRIPPRVRERACVCARALDEIYAFEGGNVRRDRNFRRTAFSIGRALCVRSRIFTIRGFCAAYRFAPKPRVALGLALIKCNRRARFVQLLSSTRFETFVRGNLQKKKTKISSLIYELLHQRRKERGASPSLHQRIDLTKHRTRVVFNTLLVALLNYPIFITLHRAVPERTDGWVLINIDGRIRDSYNRKGEGRGRGED